MGTSNRSFYLFLASLMLTGWQLLPTAAMAQGYTESDLEKMISEQERRDIPVKNMASSAAITESEGKVEEVLKETPAPNAPNTMKLPPMTGIRQLAKSPEMRDMLKKLIVADVPVMVQTMMMVENGAATGYLGSMNTLNGLLSNTMQAGQLNMQINSAIDHDGSLGLNRQFAESAFRSMRFSDGNEGVWPAALMWASGDRFDDSKDKQFTTFRENKNPAGANAADLVQNPSKAATTAGETKLSDLIFPTPTSGESQALKTDLLDWVGDLKTTSNPKNNSTDQPKTEFIEANTPNDPVLNGPPFANAFAKKRFIFQQIVWENLHKVMEQYCNFKKNNPNNGVYIFDKKRASDEIQDENFQKIQSFDIQVQINLIDQFFKLMMARRPLEEIDCSSFKGDRDTMPFDVTSGGGGGGSTKFDSCDGENAKKCLRNRILWEITTRVAESKLNHYYRILWQGTYRNTNFSPHLEDALTRLFCTNLALGQPCDPELVFTDNIQQNRHEWLAWLNKFSKLAQGQGGSSVFRPLSSSINNIGAASQAGSGGGTP